MWYKVGRSPFFALVHWCLYTNCPPVLLQIYLIQLLFLCNRMRFLMMPFAGRSATWSAKQKKCPIKFPYWCLAITGTWGITARWPQREPTAWPNHYRKRGWWEIASRTIVFITLNNNNKQTNNQEQLQPEIRFSSGEGLMYPVSSLWRGSAFLLLNCFWSYSILWS